MNSLDEYKALAKEQVEAGDYGAAIRSMTDAIALDNMNPTLYLTRGLAYLMRQDYDFAIEDMTAVLAIEHQHLDAILMRGSAFLKRGEVDAALDDFNEFINIDPEHANAPYGQRAVVFARKGKLQAALKDFDRALAQESAERGKLLYQRGTIKYALGDFDACLTDYEQAIDAGYGRPEVYAAQGSAYAQLNQLALADEAFSEAITRDKRDAEAHYNRGAVRFRQGRTAEAIVDFSQALRFADDYHSARYARAIAYLHNENYRDARRDLSIVIDHDPQHAGAHWRRGIAYHKRGKLERALMDYEQAVMLAPGDAAYLTSLGETEIELETYDNAIGYLKRALLHQASDGSVGHCRILASLAVAYYLNAQDSEAERYYTMLLNVDLIYGDVSIWRERFGWSAPLLEAADAMIAMVEANTE